MEQGWSEKRTIRFRGTDESKNHVSSNNKQRVENVENPPHYKSQLSDGQDKKKQSTYIYT